MVFFSASPFPCHSWDLSTLVSWIPKCEQQASGMEWAKTEAGAGGWWWQGRAPSTLGRPCRHAIPSLLPWTHPLSLTRPCSPIQLKGGGAGEWGSWDILTTRFPGSLFRCSWVGVRLSLQAGGLAYVTRSALTGLTKQQFVLRFEYCHIPVLLRTA